MNQPKLHRGKLAKHPRILGVRPLEREDLAVLSDKRAPQGRVRQLRAHHHRIAYMLASDMSVREVSEVTGYSISRILQLKDDPTFQQLMAEAKPDAQATARRAVDEYTARSIENALMAKEIEGEHLYRCLDRMREDPESELIPLKYLLPLTADFGDRFGYSKKVENTNKVVDIGKIMEQVAVARGITPVIDATPRLSQARSDASKPAEAPASPASQPSQAELAVGTGIRRRL